VAGGAVVGFKKRKTAASVDSSVRGGSSNSAGPAAGRPDEVGIKNEPESESVGDHQASVTAPVEADEVPVAAPAATTQVSADTVVAPGGKVSMSLGGGSAGAKRKFRVRAPSE
jgi:hypothetical protein